jgi:hypothetical protein
MAYYRFAATAVKRDKRADDCVIRAAGQLGTYIRLAAFL